MVISLFPVPNCLTYYTSRSENLNSILTSVEFKPPKHWGGGMKLNIIDNSVRQK